MQDTIKIVNGIEVNAIDLGYGDWIITPDGTVAEVQSTDKVRNNIHSVLVTVIEHSSVERNVFYEVSRFRQFQTLRFKLSQ